MTKNQLQMQQLQYQLQMIQIVDIKYILILKEFMNI